MNVPFLEAIARGGLVGDGAMGSLLYERGVFVNRNFDEVTLQQPELVYRIHREYLLAGAHLIESNTYGANRIRLGRHGLADHGEQINRKAIDLVHRAAQDAAYIGGSMGPTGLDAHEVFRRRQEVHAAYAEQAKILTEAGSHVLIIETFHHPLELQVAVEAARSVSSLPIVAHIVATDEGHIADGSDPAKLAKSMHAWGADVVGANCNAPRAILDVATRMVDSGLPVSAMPNAGLPQSIEDRLIYLATPENFGVFARRLYKAGVKLVGGCCGTGPAHITRVSSAARMVAPRLDVRPPDAVVEHVATPAKPVTERSALGAMLGKRFVVSVEVNPEPGLDVAGPVEAARMLRKAGADIINIADGPRATVRMGNWALCLQMQQQLQIETLMHVCTRDRNLLGLQSFCLGAHAMGLRNMVVITGDPPKIGDYPDATAVYDVDSIGLLNILNGYNCGIDPAGKSMAATHFVLATGVEPAANDFHREMVRLRQKVEAGANLIMTQPVYEPQHLERFLEATGDLDVAVLVGILPLASYRNAEFIHNHIPGMSVPESIRKRMRQAGKGEQARREGTQIALEALMAVRHRVVGAYIMPPLGKYDMAAHILEALGPDRTISRGVPGLRQPCSAFCTPVHSS